MPTARSNTRSRSRVALIFLALTGMLLVVSASACGVGDDDSSGDDETITVGMVSLANDPLFATYEVGAERAASEFNVDLDIQQFTDFTAAASTEALNAMAAKQPDVLATTVIEADAIQAPLERIANQGITIVTYDSPAGDPEAIPVEAFSGPDWEAVGEATGEELVKLIDGEGKVLGFSAFPGLQALEDQQAGFERVLEEQQNIEYLGLEYNDFEASKTDATVKSTLAAHPDLAGVYLGTTVLGAAEGGTAALRDAGKIDEVATVAIDATPKGVEQLKQGFIDVIVGFDPQEIGYNTIKSAREAFDGEVELPMQLEEPCVITPENVDDESVQSCLYLEP